MVAVRAYDIMPLTAHGLRSPAAGNGNRMLIHLLAVGAGEGERSREEQRS
jgi:hypothetical protein